MTFAATILKKIPKATTALSLEYFGLEEILDVFAEAGQPVSAHSVFDQVPSAIDSMPPSTGHHIPKMHKNITPITGYREVQDENIGIILTLPSVPEPVERAAIMLAPAGTIVVMKGKRCRSSRRASPMAQYGSFIAAWLL